MRAALASLGLVLIESERCQCGHSRDAHEHYRSGQECAICFLIVPAGDLALCMRYRPIVQLIWRKRT